MGKMNATGKATRPKTGGGKDMNARRREVRMKRAEEKQERRRISNMKREQAVRNSESKRKVREQRGGMGMTIVFYDVKPPRRPFGGILGRKGQRK